MVNNTKPKTPIYVTEQAGPASSEPIVTPRHISEVGNPQDVTKITSYATTTTTTTIYCIVLHYHIFIAAVLPLHSYL